MNNYLARTNFIWNKLKGEPKIIIKFYKAWLVHMFDDSKLYFAIVEKGQTKFLNKILKQGFKK